MASQIIFKRLCLVIDDFLKSKIKIAPYLIVGFAIVEDYPNEIQWEEIKRLYKNILTIKEVTPLEEKEEAYRNVMFRQKEINPDCIFFRIDFKSRKNIG